jgi:hypothetical protein
MAWPQATDYSTAIQNPAGCFADAELAAGSPATDPLGLPLTYAGNFANVYKVVCPGEQAWAVKCFTREVPDLQHRYALISDHLEKHHRPFAVEFRYLEQGVKVRGAWYPILKMRWVEGFTLNELLREHAGNIALLDRLSWLWLRLASEMREARLGHGDLQHGNVLLMPGSKASAMVLRLIDYDGMWVPELAGWPPDERGHPNYQHPERLSEGGYAFEVDRFAHLVVFAAVRCLAAGGKALWDRYDNGENLLFREADFRQPARSKLWPELLSLPDPVAATLAGHLLAASQQPQDLVPLLADLAAEGKVLPLSGEEREVIDEAVPGVLHPRADAAPAPDWLADTCEQMVLSEDTLNEMTPLAPPAPIVESEGLAADRPGAPGVLRRMGGWLVWPLSGNRKKLSAQGKSVLPGDE